MNCTDGPAKSDFPSVWVDFLLKIQGSSGGSKYRIDFLRVLWYNTHIQRTTQVVFFLLPATAGVFLPKEENMSIKEYTSMQTRDWVQAAGTLANI